VAQPSPRAPPCACRVQPKHPCIASRTHPARAVPGPRPEHAHTHQPPCRPHVTVHTFQVRAGDSRCCTRRFLAREYACSLRRFQRYHPRVRQPPPWLSGFESGVRTRCSRPFSPPPFALTAAQPSARAPPHVCCVHPKHPCIACRTHSAQAVPLPRPEHAHTHRPPCRPHVAGAYVSGPGWRLPGCEKTFFGAISTCAPASFQRCHAQVRLLPCAVASCCLLWCLAVWPVRG
jgi:hypothetical protein